MGALAARSIPRSRELRRRLGDRLRTVLDVSRLLRVPDQATLLGHISAAVCDLVGAEVADVVLVDDPGRTATTAPLDLPVHVFRSEGPGGVDQRLCAPMRDLDRRIIGMIEARGKKAGGFTDEDGLALELLAEHAALAVQRYRLLREAAHGEELRREMELAREVQVALLPQDVPRVPNLGAVGWTCSASLTGGDAYDLWRVADDRLAVLVGDASGHGLAAALVITQVRSMFRALSEVSAEPEWLMSRVNARLVQDLEPGRFVTAFLATVDARGEVRWCSAGQGPIFVRQGAGHPWEILVPGAMPLGVVGELAPEPTEPIQLEPGGALLAATDGPFEARRPDGQMFGAERLLEVLQGSSATDAEELVAEVRDAVADWRGEEQAEDDQTIVAVSFWPT